jgi:hypothetical protein
MVADHTEAFSRVGLAPDGLLPGQSAKSLSRGKRRPFRRKRKGQAPLAGYGAEWLVEGNQVVCNPLVCFDLLNLDGIQRSRETA